MTNDIKLIVYPVKDLDAAKTLYGKFLGVEPYADSHYYVGYRVGDLEVGLVPGGSEIISYIEVDDIKSSIQTLLDAGATLNQDIKDVASGLLVASVKDADGNVLGFRQQPKQ